MAVTGAEQRGARAYIWFAIGFAAILAGFWPTFYGDPASNDLWHTVHGIASTLWVVLLITRSALIGRGNRQLHEKLGWLSLALVAILFMTSGYMVWVELVSDEPFPPDLRLSLLFLDAVLLSLFLAMFSLAIIYRRQPRLHARLMGATLLIGLAPALGRLYAEHVPALHGLGGALPWTFWTIEGILIIAVILEFRRGKLLWPFPTILAAFIATQLGTIWATGHTFASIARAAGAPI